MSIRSRRLYFTASALFVAAAAFADGETSPIHRVVGVQPPAELRFEDGGHAIIRKGVGVQNDQNIYVGPGGEVRIVCANGHPLRLGPGSHTLTCPTGEALMNHQGIRLIGIRGGEPTTSYPIVLSPRGTALRTPRPHLRWRAPRQAPQDAEYTVKLLTEQKEVWRTTVRGTETPYPDAPQLEAGPVYRLEVIFEGHSSLKEKRADLGFWLIPDEQQTLVRERLKRLEELDLEPPLQTLLIANALASQTFLPNGSAGGLGLYAEAIDLLEATPLADGQELLGELYLRVQLLPEARLAWTEAIQSFREAGDDYRETRLSAHLKALGDGTGQQP